MKNAGKWGLMTFSMCISCGLLGHYLSAEMAALNVVIFSALGGVFGQIIAMEEK